jgi:predicted ATP-dependent serine protease
MATPKLIDVSWLGPKDEMDRASHLFGKCSQCNEIICVEKAMDSTQNTQQETNEMIYKAFHTHVKLKHSEDASQAETKKTPDDYGRKVGS